MAIYKKPAGYKSANFRQGLFWAIWGFLAGVYTFQPMLKRAHREEKSIIYEYFKDEFEKTENP